MTLSLKELDKYEKAFSEGIDLDAYERAFSGEAEPSQRTVSGAAADVGVSLGKGVVSLGESAVGIADIPTLGLVGKALETVFGYDPETTQQVLSNLYSVPQQEANQAVAEAKGFFGTAKTMIEYPSTIG